MANKLNISTIESEAVSCVSRLGGGDSKLVSSEDDCDDLNVAPTAAPDLKTYPFALVLRLRVLQIVCGISAMVMGTVALIEERGQMNLGLGLPAGAMTVVAGCVSIHCSRGFGGYESSGCSCGKLRWLGPNPRTAALLAALWGTALLLIAALGVRSCLTLLPSTNSSPPSSLSSSSADLHVLALVQLSLVLLVVGGGVFALSIDCSRDPD